MLSFSLVAEALTGLIYQHPSGENSKFLPWLEVDMDSSSTSSACTQDNSNSVNSDDAFLEIQRATVTVGKIYNDYFALTGADFISSLSECCNCYELRYIRDMMVSKTKQSVGPLVERRGPSNLKENLLKDIYNLYSFGEGSIHSLPKNMIKCDSKYVDQCTQTDSCLSSTIFASKLDLDTLKSELMHKISDLRHEMLNTNLSRSPMPNTLLSSHSQPTILDTLPFLHSQSVSQVEDSQFLLLSSEPDPQSVAPKIINENSYQCNELDHNNNQPKSNRKIVIAGDSLLHRLNSRKTKVNNILSIRLTKRGDNLSGTVSRLSAYIGKDNNQQLDIVLLAATNDLSKRDVSSEDLMKELDDSITELKRFSNVGQIFLCKIPPRFDHHNINTKVCLFSELLAERFLDTEDFLTVVDTVQREIKFYYQDGLHLGNLGIAKLCGII